MAEGKQTFRDVPVGAVYEAAQLALRKLGHNINEEDPYGRVIGAKSKASMKSYGQHLTLSMTEIGPATELTITTKSGQIGDWGEGKQIINDLLLHIEEGIAAIRAEGRIAAATAPSYSMGQMRSSIAAPPPPSAAPAKEKSGGMNWVFRGLLIIGVLWMINTEQGSAFFQSLFGGFGVETDISKYDCRKVADLFEGESLQNAFGGSFKIIRASSERQIMKTSTMIVCEGSMRLGNGTTQQMTMTVEKGGNSSEILYRAEPR